MAVSTFTTKKHKEVITTTICCCSTTIALETTCWVFLLACSGLSYHVFYVNFTTSFHLGWINFMSRLWCSKIIKVCYLVFCHGYAVLFWFCVIFLFVFHGYIPSCIRHVISSPFYIEKLPYLWTCRIMMRSLTKKICSKKLLPYLHTILMSFFQGVLIDHWKECSL